MMTLVYCSPPLHSVGSVQNALSMSVDLYGSAAPMAKTGVPLVHPDGVAVRAWRDDETGEIMIDLHPCAPAEVDHG